MKITKHRYPFIFFYGDYDNLKEATEDVFYKDGDSLYSQFYKGQLIPEDIYKEVFGENVESKKEEVNPIEEKEIETQSKAEPISEVVQENKPRKIRRKSLIKK